MIQTVVILLSLAGAAGTDAPAELPVEQFAQLTIRQRVIVRVPTNKAPASKPVEWREKKAPRCMAMDSIAGAAVTKLSSVDFILKGGVRRRAVLERACPALDYYSGFYIAPTADGQICADRDAIHARSGGECQITRFRTLVPREKR